MYGGSAELSKMARETLTALRCSLCSSHYLDARTLPHTEAEAAGVSRDSLARALTLALGTEGREVYPSDAEFQGGRGRCSVLEEQRFKKGVWSVDEWRLILCVTGPEPAGEEEIEELGRLVRTEQAAGGTVVSPAGFTHEAAACARRLGIELMDFSTLRALLERAATDCGYCPACMEVPRTVRERCSELAREMDALADAGSRWSGRWTPPLQVRTFAGEVMRRVRQSLVEASSPREKEAIAAAAAEALARTAERVRALRDELDELDRALDHGNGGSG